MSPRLCRRRRANGKTDAEPGAAPDVGRITVFRGAMSHARPPRVSLYVGRQTALGSESTMLSLDDDRWERLTTFFGSPNVLPNVLRQWLASIGSDEEETIYGRDLFDLFLHQATITNAAFAVVPWLVDVCKRQSTKRHLEYLTDVALVEANRLKYGVYFNRIGTEENPEWLMPDYHQAIVESRNLADDALDAEHDEDWKRGLVKLKPALYGDAELAWLQWHTE